MFEVWKNIVDYEEHYQISNYGNVKSLKREREIILKTYINKLGYVIVNLSLKGTKTNWRVHRLVGVAFIPNIKNKKTINHKDGNKLNNNIDNLEWMTQKENIQHSFKNGLQKTRAKRVLMLTIDNNPLIWFDSVKEASEQTENCIYSIKKCCQGSRNKTRNNLGQFKWSHNINKWLT